MDNFTAITSFGSLTIKNQRLNFEDFDKNGDGTISQEEYRNTLNSLKLDSVEFDNIDTNTDKQISKEEFSLWEQKTVMQDAVNGLANQISIDFAGKSQYLEELTESLRNLINEYASMYYGDVSQMADDFIKELPEKYENIKNTILANDSSTISAQVIYEMAEKFSNESYNGIALRSDIISKIIADLNGEASRFLSTYTGSTFAQDLKYHLEEYLDSSEAEIMSESVEAYRQKIADCDENSDIQEVKDAVKELLQAGIEKGIGLKVDGYSILTDSAITAVLARYTDSDSLLQAVENAINALNTTKKFEAYLEDSARADETEKEQKFMNITGSEYQIDISLLDYTKLDSRYSDGGEIYYKSRKNMSKENAYNEGFALLTDDVLKNQLKVQIQTMLKEKGFSFDKVSAIFENVYNQTARETLNQEGMITGREKKGAKRAIAQINVKTMYDTFLTNFNNNITSAIDSINASNKDFDVIDIDYNVLNSNGVAENGEDFATLYASGQIISIEGKGADYYAGIAEKLIRNLKQQMFVKAQSMCKNNGVKFDNIAFERIFESAKAKGIAAGTSGTGRDAISEAGKTTGIAVTGTVLAVAGTPLITAASVGLAFGLAASLTGLGWAVTALCAVAAGLLTYFATRKPSESTLDTKTLIDTFTQSFATDYTQWVESAGNNTITAGENATNNTADTNSNPNAENGTEDNKEEENE